MRKGGNKLNREREKAVEVQTWLQRRRGKLEEGREEETVAERSGRN